MPPAEEHRQLRRRIDQLLQGIPDTNELEECLARIQVLNAEIELQQEQDNNRDQYRDHRDRRNRHYRPGGEHGRWDERRGRRRH